MIFKYKATTKDGRTISGTAEAASRAALIELLHKQELHPLFVKADRRRGRSGSLLGLGSKKKVKLADLVVFTRQLSTMVSAGVPLGRSLAALQADADSPYLRE